MNQNTTTQTTHFKNSEQPKSVGSSLGNLLETGKSTFQDLIDVEKKLDLGVKSMSYYPELLAKKLVSSGGKRIRPLLMSLAYRTVEKSNEKAKTLEVRADQDALTTLAAVAEWVHTATLFHDDVLDHSVMRRNKRCAHQLFGNHVSILVGDFVYAEAFNLLMEKGLLYPSQKLAKTIKELVDGELLQHEMVLSREINYDAFETSARAKTASLFSWCTEMGAWAAGYENLENAYKLGQCLGISFQFADDLLDTFDLDILNYDEVALNEWIQSSPPYPLVIASQSDDSIAKLWKELPHLENVKTKKTAILDLQVKIANTDVLKTCHSQIVKHIAETKIYIAEMGHHQIFEDSSNVILERALKGISQAELISKKAAKRSHDS